MYQMKTKRQPTNYKYVHTPVRRPFLIGELSAQAGMTGKGHRKSLCNRLSAVTKSSTRATRVRSRHSQPISSKPSCAEKQPSSLSLTCSRRCRAWRHSIISMYIFSAQSLSLFQRSALHMGDTVDQNITNLLRKYKHIYMFMCPGFKCLQMHMARQITASACCDRRGKGCGVRDESRDSS